MIIKEKKKIKNLKGIENNLEFSIFKGIATPLITKYPTVARTKYQSSILSLFSDSINFCLNKEK